MGNRKNIFHVFLSSHFEIEIGPSSAELLLSSARFSSASSGFFEAFSAAAQKLKKEKNLSHF